MPTAPVAPDDADSVAHRRSRWPPAVDAGRVLGLDRVGAELERLVQRAGRRRSTRSAAITQEILIGEVEIISMLMPSLAERREDLGGDAGVAAHAGADDRDLADLARRSSDLAEPTPSAVERVARASRRSSRGDGEREVGAAASSETGSFWMIMSTLTFASASAVKMRPATPGLVADAEQRDAGLVGRSA